MTCYRFVEVCFRRDEESLSQIRLCKVDYSETGRPVSVEDTLFNTKREYRDAFRQAMKEPVERFFASNGTFFMSKHDVTWVWQENVTDEELYSVYGGD